MQIIRTIKISLILIAIISFSLYMAYYYLPSTTSEDIIINSSQQGIESGKATGKNIVHLEAEDYFKLGMIYGYIKVNSNWSDSLTPNGPRYHIRFELTYIGSPEAPETLELIFGSERGVHKYIPISDVDPDLPGIVILINKTYLDLNAFTTYIPSQITIEKNQSVVIIALIDIPEELWQKVTVKAPLIPLNMIIIGEESLEKPIIQTTG
jgi:hypothetical protein